MFFLAPYLITHKQHYSRLRLLLQTYRYLFCSMLCGAVYSSKEVSEIKWVLGADMNIYLCEFQTSKIRKCHWTTGQWKTILLIFSSPVASFLGEMVWQASSTTGLAPRAEGEEENLKIQHSSELDRKQI